MKPSHLVTPRSMTQGQWTNGYYSASLPRRCPLCIFVALFVVWVVVMLGLMLAGVV